MNFKIKCISGMQEITEKDIKYKKFNIWIGISLENKWFTKENLKEYILWALKYSKSKITVLIGDTLNSVNYEVISKYNPSKARRRAIKKGNEIQMIIEDIVKELPPNLRYKVQIARWSNIINKERNEEKKILYKKFETDKKFREHIRKIVRSFTERLSKNFSLKSIDNLATYILDELPDLLLGFKYNGILYNLYPYPKNTEIAKLVEKIQKKEIFPELHDKLKIINHVFVWMN